LLAQLPRHFAVVGWSLGGLYAQRLALEESPRVQYLLSVASSPRFIAAPTWPAVPKQVFINFYNKLSQDIEGTLRDFVSLQLNKNKANLNIGKMPSIEGLEAGLLILDDWDFRAQLNHLTIPTCFMFGRLDPITPARIMETMKVIYPQFNYILFKRSAHIPFLTHKDLFIDELKRFIQ
jgi:pimeloyl-[acyl-carrier protein] methyl ester esterase